MRGLVLAGGGAKGAYQIGVWKALRELDIEINVVCGTSIGAFNGAFIAQGQFSKAYNHWSNMQMNDLFDMDDTLLEAYDKWISEKKVPKNLKVYKEFYNHIKSFKGLDITPLRNKIEEYLDEDLLMKSSIDYGLVTFSLNKLRPVRVFKEDIPKEELKHYLLGSAMVPGFARDKNDPMKFVDGGVYDNLPIKMALERGCNEVVAVSLNPIKRRKYKENVIYIEPSADLGNFLHVSKERIHKNIRLGYLDALRVFKQLYGNRFYFNEFYSEREALMFFVDLPFSQKDLINRLVMGKNLPNERFFFEKTLPKIAKNLNLNSNSSYKEIKLSIYEKLMADSEYDKLKVYSHVTISKELSSNSSLADSALIHLL